MVRALVLSHPETFELRDLPPPSRDDKATVRVELRASVRPWPPA